MIRPNLKWVKRATYFPSHDLIKDIKTLFRLVLYDEYGKPLELRPRSKGLDMASDQRH